VARPKPRAKTTMALDEGKMSKRDRGPTLPTTELRACLDRELAHLMLPRGPITVRLRLEGGRIRRVALQGGLATPACARQLLLDRPYPGADQTWQTVDLPAK
jgi:hypothetical protein